MFDDLQYLQDREKCETLVPTFQETWKQETDKVKAKQQQRLVGSSRLKCDFLAITMTYIIMHLYLVSY